MNIQHSSLENGLRVVTAEMSESQSVTAAVFVGVGSRYENWSMNGGVSHMLEHLLFKGTAKRPTAKQISEEIDAVGGWTNAYTSNDVTCFYVKVPKQHGALALEILSDIIQNPLFDQIEMDRERRAIMEEMSMIKDDPARFVGDLLTPLLWPNDQLGRPILGDENVVRTIPRQSVIDYKQRHYGANNMVVVVAGQISHEVVLDFVSRQMNELTPIERQELRELDLEASGPVSESLKDDTNQAHFSIGSQAFKYEDSSQPVARIIAAVLGRGMSSRLFNKVRSTQGLAYDISADCQSFVDTGMFEVYVGANADKAAEAVASIMEELQLIRVQPVDKLELMKAKNQLRGGLQMAMESNSNVADRLGTQLILLNKIRSMDELLAEVDAVSVDDVQRVAGEMLSPHKLRMAIIAPDPAPAEATFMEAVNKNYGKS